MDPIDFAVIALDRLPFGWMSNVTMISRMVDPDVAEDDKGRWIISLSHIQANEVQNHTSARLAYIAEARGRYGHTRTRYWRYGVVFLATTEILDREPARHLVHVEDQ